MAKAGANVRDNRGETEDVIILLQEVSDFSVQLLHIRSQIDAKRARRISHQAMSRIDVDQILPLKNQLKAMYLRSQQKVDIPLKPVTCLGGVVANAVKWNWSLWPEYKPDKLTVTSYSYDKLASKDRSGLPESETVGQEEIQNSKRKAPADFRSNSECTKRSRAQTRLRDTVVRLRHVVSNSTAHQPRTSKEYPNILVASEEEITTFQEKYASKLREEQRQDDPINLECTETFSKGSEAIPPSTDGTGTTDVLQDIKWMDIDIGIAPDFNELAGYIDQEYSDFQRKMNESEEPISYGVNLEGCTPSLGFFHLTHLKNEPENLLSHLKHVFPGITSPT